MDPADHTASLTMDVLDPMYECLTRFDQNLEVSPSLATKWSVDSSGTKWTLELRKGVRFHDGTPFDAQAVVDSFNRLLDPDRGLAAASRVRAIVKRITADRTGHSYFHAREFLCLLSQSAGGHCDCQPVAEKHGELSRPAIGTGPYRFVEWKTGEYVLEERNDQYWGPRPAVKQLKWIWTSEPVLMNMSVLAGEADIVNPLPPIFAEALSRNRKVKPSKEMKRRSFGWRSTRKRKPLDDMRYAKP